MRVFHYPLYEHEPFWRYLSTLSDFCAQLVNYMFERSKNCEVIYAKVSELTRAILN